MDYEKQSQISDRSVHEFVQPTGISLLRVAQYTWSTISLVFMACAIDRNILIPGVANEEIVGCVSVSSLQNLKFDLQVD